MDNNFKKGFLVTGIQSQCHGCEACVQICGHNALAMKEDEEGFRYPVVDTEACVHCGLCNKVCPVENPPLRNQAEQTAYGGSCINPDTLENSTSGGAFSAIIDGWCKDNDNYVIFGAVSDGLDVRHCYVTDKALIQPFRKSKYSQSIVGHSYTEARDFLKQGKNVVFSGTPCQIGGLINYLEIFKVDMSALLTIEVVCEGVPTPLYMRKLDDYMQRRYGAGIAKLDYRHKKSSRWDSSVKKPGLNDRGKWDFEVCSYFLKNGVKLRKDRWFNPFWSIWLQHLMSRPSCYECPYATTRRVADITLGDLWGVHIYCPDLYNHNGGASLVVANSPKGKEALEAAKLQMKGRDLRFEDALRYQSPMRNHIQMNSERTRCMADLMNTSLTYEEINSKWAKKPTLKLLTSKYVYGNRQRVAVWNFKQIIKKLFR